MIYHHGHQYGKTYGQPHGSQQPTATSRCTTNFFPDNKLDMNALQSANIKLDTDTKNKFNEYKSAIDEYNKGSSFFTKSCREISTNKNKNTSRRSKCSEYQKIISNVDYKTPLKKHIKTKLTKKFKQVLKHPKEKRLKKLSCYINILQQLCTSLSPSNIIHQFRIEYQKIVKEQTKKDGAPQYLEYLLTNKTLNANDLIEYHKWFKDDPNFITALDNVIKTCN